MFVEETTKLLRGGGATALDHARLAVGLGLNTLVLFQQTLGRILSDRAKRRKVKYRIR